LMGGGAGGIRKGGLRLIGKKNAAGTTVHAEGKTKAETGKKANGSVGNRRPAGGDRGEGMKARKRGGGESRLGGKIPYKRKKVGESAHNVFEGGFFPLKRVKGILRRQKTPWAKWHARKGVQIGPNTKGAGK